jgi:hypothetical protein
MESPLYKNTWKRTLGAKQMEEKKPALKVGCDP